MQFQQDGLKDKKNYSSLLSFLLEGSKVPATRAKHGYHSCFDISARIATKLHKRTKNLL